MIPFLGPNRSSGDPLTERAEVEDARRVLYLSVPGADPDWLSEAEAFGSADELAARRELQDWSGVNPFELS